MNLKTKQCYRKPLNDSFHPIEVPITASYVDTRVIGTNAVAGEGVQVDLWAGDTDGNFH